MEDNIFEQYAELVRRVKAGDEYAFTELFEKSKRLVYATCYGILNNQQDAEEAMLDTYLAVSQNINKLEDEYTFLHWLKTIAANKARDKFKARKGDLSYDDAVESGEDLEGDDNLETLPDSLIMEKTKRDTLLGIIRKELSDVQFQTVYLYYYNELSYADISKIMGCPEETVKSRLKSSRIKIKAGIKEYEKVNKDSLMAGAASVPFLSRLFTEFADDLKVPSVNPFPSKNAAGPKGNQVKADAAKATAKSLSEKAVVQTGAKATLAGASGLKMTAIIVGAVVGIGAIGGAIFGISRLISENTAETSEETEEVVIVETEETEAGPLSVDVNVMVFDGHSYALYDNCSSWEDAEAYCESVGGHLAVITSQEENDAVFAYAQSCGCDNVYIGYSDISNEGVWEWVTGESSDYTNWNEGEPNAFTPEENYAVMAYNGGWNDCSYAPAAEGMNAVYVCEWDEFVEGVSNIDRSDIPDPVLPMSIEEIRVNAYTHYLEVLESSYDSIDEYWSPFTLATGEWYSCDLTDVTGDGIEELLIVDCNWIGAGPVLHVYTYDAESDSVTSILQEYVVPEGGGGADNVIALSDTGSIIIYNGAVAWEEDYSYRVYTFNGTEFVNELNLDEYVGIDPEIYDQMPTEYSINGEIITADEFNSNAAAVQSSMAVLMQHTGGSGFNNFTSSFPSGLRSTISSLNMTAMTYEDMYQLLASGITQTSDASSEAGTDDWKTAYISFARSATTDIFSVYDASANSQPMQYGLAYINADDIPELICSAYNGWSTCINIYTYNNGEVIQLGHTMSQTNMIITYSPRNNCICFNDTTAETMDSSYLGINDTNDDIVTLMAVTSAMFDLTQYRLGVDSSSLESFDTWHDFIFDTSTGSYYVELSAEQVGILNTYRNYTYEPIEGTLALTQLLDELNN